VARDIALLWWAMCGFFTLVLVVVSALWIYALWRKPREYSPDEARRIQRRWLIGGGILLPSVTIVLLLAFGIPVGQRMMQLPIVGERPLQIHITGHQWWWEVRYPDSGVVTANQLHLPAGRPVDITVSSADVIHSFWVPRLGGKIDMIPGRENRIRLQADNPGTFRGQCTEFCGTQHSHMVLDVQAHSEEDFAAWIDARREPRVEALQGPAADTFLAHCGMCHRVAGVSAGNRAPDLTDLASRRHLGGGVIGNEPGAILTWIREHGRLKPGTGMPLTDDLDAEHLQAIATWLEGLEP